MWLWRQPWCLPAVEWRQAQDATPAAAPTATGQAAASPQAGAQDVAGIWQGKLHIEQANRDLRTEVKIAKAADGSYKSTFYSIDQGGQPIPVDKTSFENGTLKFSIGAINGSYEGKMSSDGKTITGTWTQGPGSLALVLERTTPDNAWPIPEPIKPMAADAHPKFDVVTVKPTPPGRPGKNIGFNGSHFLFRGANLDDIIALGYGLHTKQIAGAPDWAGQDLFDIEGTPDVPGRPNQKQIQDLLHDLLADRFALKFHNEKRELAVYVITVAPSGPKLTKTTAASADDGSGMGFGSLGGQGVTAIGRNLTMADFAMWFQSGVTDRPVVDQTGIEGRYDIRLKWTPDDSQFAQFGGSGFHAPPPSDAADAPPALYTAIQEQLGLKIEATKAPDEVMVIDHVDKPSPN